MTTATSKGKVVLYMPHLVLPEHRSPDYMAAPPLSLLALAAPLRQAGYDVVLIDAKWESQARDLVNVNVGDAVCLGISCLAGTSVTEGLEVAALAKRQRPDLPVVWGGWHPSFVAKQVAEDDLGDIVVRGPGERSFVEVVDALAERRSLSNIAGIAYSESTGVVETPERPLDDINSYPPLAYDLIDPTRYVYATGSVRHANVIASRGCPYSCDFCLDSRSKWFGLAPERVEEELAFWVRGHDVNHVRFWDGNFFLRADWITGICDRLTEGDLAGRFQWTATGVASRIAKMNGELLTRIRKAGCRQVAIGGETGSHELLKQITNKTTVEQTIEAVRILTAHDIQQHLFFMVGYPDEPDGALEDTMALITKLKSINPYISFQTNYVIPLPGSETFRIAVQKGLFPAPTKLADWGRLDFHKATFPTVDRHYERRVSRFLEYIRIAYPSHAAVGTVVRSVGALRLFAPLRWLASWRLSRLIFAVPFDAALVGAYRKFRLAGRRWLARA